MYHANDPVEWLGSTGFYHTDYRSTLDRDEGKTWEAFCVWADPSYAPANMFVSFEAEARACRNLANPAALPPSDRHYLLELVSVPDGVTGAPEVGTVWELSLDELFTLELPTYRTNDGLSAYEFTFTVTEAGASPGDFDNDGDVDHDDYQAFEQCFTGPGGQVQPGCEIGDFDGDADIDCDDWDGFVLAWTEPGSPPALPGCGPPIPALSTWGLVLMTLLALIAGTTVVRARGESSPGCP